VQGVESTDGRPNKLAEEIRDNPSNPTPSHVHRVYSQVSCAIPYDTYLMVPSDVSSIIVSL